MMKRKIEKIVRDICAYNGFSKVQEEQINYTLKVIIYEIIKFTLLILIFALLGYFKESILIVVVMMITKPFIGGYHEDTQFKCFLATVLLVIFIIYLSTNIHLDFVSSIILNLISTFVIYNKAPIINNKMPITKENLIKRNRVIGITNTIIICSVSLLIFGSSVYSEVLIWSVVVQAMLMFNKR